MTYTTAPTIRIAGLTLAILMATLVNGSLLWKMDDVAQTASVQPTTHITLETVTIVGRQS